MTDIPFPPTDMMFDGPQDVHSFRTNGEEFLGYYKDICGLKPDERMLDVGSGIGRKTIPLTGYLSAAGSYEGFDCNKSGVDWCQENITSRFPNFRFGHVDVYAPGYNPQGTIWPINFLFPFEDDTFDFVTLGSVFTHMQYNDVRHYMREIERVLKPNGRCLITWFLCPMDKQPPLFPYKHQFGWMADKSMPEQAIAFDTDTIMMTYEDTDLRVRRVEYGTWSGRSGLSYQDMILASKA